MTPNPTPCGRRVCGEERVSNARFNDVSCTCRSFVGSAAPWHKRMTIASGVVALPFMTVGLGTRSRLRVWTSRCIAGLVVALRAAKCPFCRRTAFAAKIFWIAAVWKVQSAFFCAQRKRSSVPDDPTAAETSTSAKLRRPSRHHSQRHSPLFAQRAIVPVPSRKRPALTASARKAKRCTCQRASATALVHIFEATIWPAIYDFTVCARSQLGQGETTTKTCKDRTIT